MCPEENNKTNDQCCLATILNVIVTLQNRSDKFDCLAEGCDRPFLGPIPTTICFNTRPISLYRCADGEAWSLPYT